MPLAQFLARSRWGTQWGVVDRAHPTPHRGHDIHLAARETVECVVSGQVVAAGLSSIVGYYIVLRTAAGFDYYCHQYGPARPAVGTVLSAGQGIGQAAAAYDIHGSAWTGPHLHYGRGPAITSVLTGPTFNATAIVVAVLGSLSTAGGGSTPLPNPQHRKDDDMPFHVQVIAGGNPSAVAVGDYIMTATGLEGATALDIGLLSKDPTAMTFICWGEEIESLHRTVSAAAFRAAQAALLAWQITQAQVDAISKGITPPEVDLQPVLDLLNAGLTVSLSGTAHPLKGSTS